MSKILEEDVVLKQQNKAAEAAHSFTEPSAYPRGAAHGLAEPDVYPEAAAQDFAKPDTHPEEAAAVLAYEEIPERKTETAVHVKLVKRKRRKSGVVTLAALVAVAGLGTAAAYTLGASGGTSVREGMGVTNITEPPAGAVVPMFSPIDPADFSAVTDGDFVVVPDETGLALPAFGHGPQMSSEPQNHYTQTPNVSTYFTRAAQDESYVYFLQGPPAGKRGLYNLMRASIATGKAESVANANEVSDSIYSFTLHGQNIITCEYKQATDSFAFYRVPKSVADAQLLFETKSPAYMNVFDGKIFLLFVEEQALGVFDPDTDTEPAYISLGSVTDNVHYFPQFAVLNGYLYYGSWYGAEAQASEDAEEDEAADAQTDEGEDADVDTNEQVRIEYLRRSLYTGETVTLLSGGAIWNPCWDSGGNAYYAQHDADAMEFALTAVQDGSNKSIGTFDYDGQWPLIAFKDEFLVAALPDGLRKYDLGDFSIKLEASAESTPFAVTKDFLITDNGMYRLFDFGFIPFSQ